MGCSETTLMELFILSKNEAHCRTAPHRCTAPLHRTAARPHCTPPPTTPPPDPCPAQVIAAGKEKWEGRSDASLIDYLDERLTSEYKHMQARILKLP
jgi:hypothetical protein